jgi:hypothetical protein
LHAQRQEVRQGQEVETLLEMLHRLQHHHPQQEEKVRLSAGWHDVHHTIAMLRRDLL